MSRELLARAWASGAGPGDAPFTIDLDSTICETYGLAKEGASHHGYTGARGYHPCQINRRWTTKLKPRWDVHSRGDEDWLGCASEALSSVLGEWSGTAV